MQRMERGLMKEATVHVYLRRRGEGERQNDGNVIEIANERRRREA